MKVAVGSMIGGPGRHDPRSRVSGLNSSPLAVGGVVAGGVLIDTSDRSRLETKTPLSEVRRRSMDPSTSVNTRPEWWRKDRSRAGPAGSDGPRRGAAKAAPSSRPVVEIRYGTRRLGVATHAYADHPLGALLSQPILLVPSRIGFFIYNAQAL